MSKKISTAQRRSGANIVLNCRECSEPVHNVDSGSISATCWKCVNKSINPNSVIITDMEPGEWSTFLKEVIFKNQ
jgi:hypothetical protein